MWLLAVGDKPSSQVLLNKELWKELKYKKVELNDGRY
jgi:hypothetical protein